MRKTIGDICFTLARRAQSLSEDHGDQATKEAWRRRSTFFADVELLVVGLIDWRTFCARRASSSRPSIGSRIRGVISDLPLGLSQRAQRRADEFPEDSSDRLYWLRRSDFWDDLRLWVSGLGEWHQLRQASEIRDHRRQRKVMRAGWPS